MRPATNELTRTSWFGGAAIVPVRCSVSPISARWTCVRVTSAMAFAPPSSSSPEALCGQPRAPIEVHFGLARGPLIITCFDTSGDGAARSRDLAVEHPRSGLRLRQLALVARKNRQSERNLAARANAEPSRPRRIEIRSELEVNCGDALGFEQRAMALLDLQFLSKAQ